MRRSVPNASCVDVRGVGATGPSVREREAISTPYGAALRRATAHGLTGPRRVSCPHAAPLSHTIKLLQPVRGGRGNVAAVCSAHCALNNEKLSSSLSRDWKSVPANNSLGGGGGLQTGEGGGGGRKGEGRGRVRGRGDTGEGRRERAGCHRRGKKMNLAPCQTHPIE